MELAYVWYTKYLRPRGGAFPESDKQMQLMDVGCEHSPSSPELSPQQISRVWLSYYNTCLVDGKALAPLESFPCLKKLHSTG